MLDNTDSDVLTLLPKNGAAAPKAESRPRAAVVPDDDADDSLGFASGNKPAVSPAPPPQQEVVASPAPAVSRSVPKLSVPPRLTVPGKGAAKKVPAAVPAVLSGAEAAENFKRKKGDYYEKTVFDPCGLPAADMLCRLQ